MDNGKNGGNGEGGLAVGLTHSRGVVGVMPDALRCGGELEGVSNQPQTDKETSGGQRTANWVATKLAVKAKLAREKAGGVFTNLLYLVNEAFLAQCYGELRAGAAPGIDGVSYQEYGEKLADNLAELVGRMKRWQYRPQPVKRVLIPKDEKSMRPLGIPAVEDKIVQLAIKKILEANYEPYFLGVSYGFRPGRGGHQALKALHERIMRKPVNYIVEADIKGFFDNVNHKQLMACLKQRIRDRGFLRLIGRFLRAGVMEEGKYLESEKGTPQGGVLSPMLANIYLHALLDVWFEGKLKRGIRGYAELIRFADDFVICVQYREDAEKILAAIRERFAKGGLELAQEKTRLVEFGRYAEERSERRGEKPGTFDFLGFTHYCTKTRDGSTFKVGRKTSRKKFRQKLRVFSMWLRKERHKAIALWWPQVRAKLLGHYQYYGISENYRSVNTYYRRVLRLIHEWLNRRSQRRSHNWKSFNQYLERHPLPKPKIYCSLYEPSPARGD